jgi:hypothetical protein
MNVSVEIMTSGDALNQALQLLFNSFPNEPPEVVVDEHWGDYRDAEEAFSAAAGRWTPEFVFEHRSIIGFVNMPAFKYLIPYFMRSCLTSEGLNFDVLAYAISEILFRIRETPNIFSHEQADAVCGILDCFECEIEQRGYRCKDILTDIAKIKRLLGPQRDPGNATMLK